MGMAGSDMGMALECMGMAGSDMGMALECMGMAGSGMRVHGDDMRQVIGDSW